MKIRFLVLLALALFSFAARPALAIVEGTPRWVPTRRPGGAIEDEPIPPFGWRAGLALQSPWSAGLSLGYVWPVAPVAVKLGGTLGVWSDRGQVVSDLSEARAYGALLYYLTPAFGGGPYAEVGLGWVRTNGAVKALPWPALPHVGFGTTGRLGEDGQTGWDVEFVWVANGLYVLETALFF